jgi:hypothetical protein
VVGPEEETNMSNQLGPIDVLCDAPPYYIVQACNRIGFHSPEDVGWCRLSNYLGHRPGWRQFIPPWNAFVGHHQAADKTCVCGQFLPQLETYTFTLITGKDIAYVLGQCRRCHTVFWEDA